MFWTAQVVAVQTHPQRYPDRIRYQRKDERNGWSVE
ncbi:hypothetical protein IH992_32680 [Candidatus Poribacteria bacterium]|nr:hypothetical protein [Candidatus Poribacteria bacterium]